MSKLFPSHLPRRTFISIVASADLQAAILSPRLTSISSTSVRHAAPNIMLRRPLRACIRPDHLFVHTCGHANGMVGFQDADQVVGDPTLLMKSCEIMALRKFPLSASVLPGRSVDHGSTEGLRASGYIHSGIPRKVLSLILNCFSAWGPLSS